MAQTPSNMVALGTIAQDFALPEPLTGKTISLKQFVQGKPFVLMFICNHCPFVKHVNAALVKLANEYIPRGISFIAISSNDAGAYPEDGPEKMKEYARKLNYPFPYLYDESQEIARLYEAACTPDFYIFNEESALVYRGQLDDSRPSNGVEVTGKDIRNALNNLLTGNPVSKIQLPSIGCNIKWKKDL